MIDINELDDEVLNAVANNLGLEDDLEKLELRLKQMSVNETFDAFLNWHGLNQSSSSKGGRKMKASKPKFSAPNKENHKALWTWLARNPRKDKCDWPGWEGMAKLGITIPQAHCFLCEEGFSCHSKCPQGPYYQWKYAETLVLRAKFAKQIAECWK